MNDNHHDPISSYTDSVAALAADQAHSRALRAALEEVTAKLAAMPAWRAATVFGRATGAENNNAARCRVARDGFMSVKAILPDWAEEAVDMFLPESSDLSWSDLSWEAAFERLSVWISEMESRKLL